jgi:hypothetical protein
VTMNLLIAFSQLRAQLFQAIFDFINQPKGEYSRRRIELLQYEKEVQPK